MRVSRDEIKIVLGAAAVGGALGVLAFGRRRGMDLRDKVVLITGSSRGLGLALARHFAAEGARLVLCARSEEELNRAQQDLAAYGRETLTIPCDVSKREDVDLLIERTMEHYGRIDVLVNNAGMIQVGPVRTMTIEDFEQAMDVMFWGVVYTTLAALPHMESRRQGRIVNVTSVGGKISVPHLLPYSCAKFAAAAFSEGLRAELRGSGIKVVTIAPGLMRTGSYLNALFKGDQDREAALFGLGATLPGISMSANRAAEQIVAATRRGSAERVLSVPANFLARFHGMFPGAAVELLSLVNRVLPHGDRKQEVRGGDTSILRTPIMAGLTILGRKAAERFLQPGVPAQV